MSEPGLTTAPVLWTSDGHEYRATRAHRGAETMTIQRRWMPPHVKRPDPARPWEDVGTARLTRGTGGPEIVNEPGGVEHPALVLRCLSINYRAGMVAG
jgi:hypothetical protein